MEKQSSNRNTTSWKRKDTRIKQARLSSLLQQRVNTRPLNQLVCKIKEGTGSNLFQQAFFSQSNQNQSPEISVDSPCFLASIDKMYNATLLLLLWEQGKVGLDDPIDKYLPVKGIGSIHLSKGSNWSKDITIRHLLTHTSGLADWLEDSPKGGKSLIEQVIESGDRYVSFDEILSKLSGELEAHFPPQNLGYDKIRARYSDTNYILLIEIIEQITGKGLAQVCEEMLLKPLELEQTYFPGLSQPLVPVMDPIPLRVEGNIIEIPELMKSFRGMAGTIDDVIRFAMALTQNRIFQNPDTLKLVMNTQYGFGLPKDKPSLRAPGWPICYGMGMMKFQLPRIFTGLKVMPTLYGHTGSTGCWVFWSPDLDLYIAGSCDEATAGALPYRLVPKILQILG